MSDKHLECIGIPLSKGHTIVGKYDSCLALTEQEARDRGYILDTNQYPHMAYIGEVITKPGDWTREQQQLVLPVYTPLEEKLRADIKKAINDLSALESKIGIIDFARISQVIGKLTESLKRIATE